MSLCAVCRSVLDEAPVRHSKEEWVLWGSPRPVGGPVCTGRGHPAQSPGAGASGTSFAEQVLGSGPFPAPLSKLPTQGHGSPAPCGATPR